MASTQAKDDAKKAAKKAEAAPAGGPKPKVDCKPPGKKDKKTVEARKDEASKARGAGGGKSLPQAKPTVPTGLPACREEDAAVAAACTGSPEKQCKDKPCQKAKKCVLQSYSEGRSGGCCGKTPHHLIEVHCFTPPGGRAEGKRLEGCEGYDDKKAPCVCVKGSRYKDEHGKLHAIQNMYELASMDPKGERSQPGGKDNAWTYAAAKQAALLAMSKAFPDNGPGGKGCCPECLTSQLDKYHASIGITDAMPMRADRSPLKQAQKDWGKDEVEKFFAAGGGQPVKSTTKAKRAK